MNTYSSFRNHPLIAKIAQKEKWTVSDDCKRPLDIYILKHEHRLAGAITNTNACLTDLDNITSFIKEPSKLTYYLNAPFDKFIILDIEPKCPDEIKAQLINIPCLYGEKSMSGKGYHLCFPFPDEILAEYPNAKNKTVLKEEHGYYEILITHYVVFTTNQISYTPLKSEKNSEDFIQLFRNLCEIQKTSVRSDLKIEKLSHLKTPTSDIITQSLLIMSEKYNKTPEDFSGDFSRYEFGYISYLNCKLNSLLNSPYLGTLYKYNESEKAYLLYTVASEYLPPRDKHYTDRNGLPWLLYLAGEVMAKSEQKELKKK